MSALEERLSLQIVKHHSTSVTTMYSVLTLIITNLCFVYLDKPHNPMVNAGAIVISSLIKVTTQTVYRLHYTWCEYILSDFK